MYRNFIKRGFDFLISFILGIALLPLFIIISMVIFIDNKGPVIFKQKRVGKNKKYFWLHKFRSMKTNTPDIPTHLLHNPDEYTTKFGKILRRTSLDELPQIYDVLFNNMSFVGPRPALWNQDDLIAERDKYGANNVKPGLTGLAQINGRDELGIERKAEYDGLYVKALNAGKFKGFLMDLKCCFGSVLPVLRCKGVIEGCEDQKHEKSDYLKVGTNTND